MVQDQTSPNPVLFIHVIRLNFPDEILSAVMNYAQWTTQICSVLARAISLWINPLNGICLIESAVEKGSALLYRSPDTYLFQSSL